MSLILNQKPEQRKDKLKVKVISERQLEIARIMTIPFWNLSPSFYIFILAILQLLKYWNRVVAVQLWNMYICQVSDLYFLF